MVMLPFGGIVRYHMAEVNCTAREWTRREMDAERPSATERGVVVRGGSCARDQNYLRFNIEP